MTTDRPAPTEGQAPVPRKSAVRLLILAAIAGAVLGPAVFYGIAGWPGKGGDPACRPAVEAARALAPLMRGDVAAMAPAQEGRRVPDLAFTDGEGRSTSLSAFRGRWVLLNLWATWCAPCREEMPALDALQAALGGPRFSVLAINIDTRNVDRARKFLSDIKVERLGFYADHSAKVFQDLKAAGRAVGMPTTLLIDPAGCEVGYMPGPAHWSGGDATALIAAAAAR